MKKVLVFLVLAFTSLLANEFNPAMQEYINSLKEEAKAMDKNFVDFDAQRGERIFSTKNKGKNGELISCQSCHNENLTKQGLNIFTDKSIEALAPSVNPTRLSEVKEVKKWLKRNFIDVYLREGNALEKGDVLYYLIKQ